MTNPYEALAHEVWAAAQLAPGEGIVDGVARIKALLRRTPHPAITHCKDCGCDWVDNGLNPIGCPYCEISALRKTAHPATTRCDNCDTMSQPAESCESLISNKTACGSENGDCDSQPDEHDLVRCAECGAELIQVRPGKWQHPDCSQSSWAAEQVKTLIDNQEPLGEEFQRVLDKHSWDLYVKTAEPVKVPSSFPAGTEYSVEPHGNGYTIYQGRDQFHHGLNLAHLTECTPEFSKRIESALNAMSEPVNKTDWNAELASWSDEDFIRIFHERPDLANRLRKMLSEPVKVDTEALVPSDLANRLRIKAGMITMGEKIAWGSDVELMLQAAQALEIMSLPEKPLSITPP